MYMEENQEDDLTRAVALFTVALAHVKTKLKSISSRRYAYILRAAVEEILLRLQNDESLIKRDVEKLNNLSHSKGKQLETRFKFSGGFYSKEEIDEVRSEWAEFVYAFVDKSDDEDER